MKASLKYTHPPLMLPVLDFLNKEKGWISSCLQKVEKYHSPLGDVLLSLLLSPSPSNYPTRDGGEIELARVVRTQWLGTGKRGKSSLNIPFQLILQFCDSMGSAACPDALSNVCHLLFPFASSRDNQNLEVFTAFRSYFQQLVFCFVE